MPGLVLCATICFFFVVGEQSNPTSSLQKKEAKKYEAAFN